METIYIVEQASNGIASDIRHYGQKEDAIKYINSVCDAYRDALDIQGVTLIYEPYREEFEKNFPIYVYFSEIQFTKHPTLFLRLKRANLY